jgi:hypothetical protein
MATAQLKVVDANAKFAGDYVKVDGTLAVDGITTLTSVKLAAATFQTNGAAWATSAAAPTFVNGQTYMTVTCGATVFRIPLFANA